MNENKLTAEEILKGTLPFPDPNSDSGFKILTQLFEAYASQQTAEKDARIKELEESLQAEIAKKDRLKIVGAEIGEELEAVKKEREDIKRKHWNEGGITLLESSNYMQLLEKAEQLEKNGGESKKNA